MRTFRNVSQFFRIWLLILLVLFVGCKTPQPLTVDQVRNYRLTEEEMKGIQYYLSREVVFSTVFKRPAGKSKAVEAGQGVFENTFEVEKLVLRIRKKTPGVCVAAKDNWIQVDFGGGVVLTFENREGMRYYFLNTGRLTIDGLNYRRQTFNSARLLAKAAFIVNIVEKRGKKAAPGRTVD